MDVAVVAKVIHERVGIDSASLGVSALDRVVSAQMKEAGLSEIDEYVLRLSADADLFQELVDNLTVPETWFFRGGAVFEFLVDTIRQACASRFADDPVRVLSIPCSSGEEPYSLAIALMEGNVSLDRWTIDGIDISRRQIRLAEAGCYRDFSFRQTDSGIRSKYFRPMADQWRIDPVLQTRVRFRRANLFDESTFAGERPFDIVLCRNLLIYFHPEARRRTFQRMHDILRPEGLLGVGHAEPLDPNDPLFQALGPTGLFLYKRVDSAGGKRPRVKEPSVIGDYSPSKTKAAETPSTRAAVLGTSPLREVESRSIQRMAVPKIEEQTQSTEASPSISVAESFERARTLADSGRLDEALAVCHLQATKGPHSADMLALMGVILQSRQEIDDAENCFQRALYLDPNHAEALMHLMLLVQARGDSPQVERLRRRIQRTSKRGEP